MFLSTGCHSTAEAHGEHSAIVANEECNRICVAADIVRADGERERKEAKHGDLQQVVEHDEIYSSYGLC